jgi:uncharacterized repeat protein (TIGR01451 family)
MGVSTEDGWDTNTNGTNYTLTYTGDYPILPGTTLPPILINGSTILNPATFNATVSTPGDTNSYHLTANDVVTLCPPSLALSMGPQNSGPFQVGDAASFFLHVTNSSTAGPVLSGNPIRLTDTIPPGLSNITANGQDWKVAFNGNTLFATYIGDYPLPSNTSIGDLIVSGQLTSSAQPTLLTMATVSTPGNLSTASGASSSIVVQPLPDLRLRIFSSTVCVQHNHRAFFDFFVSNSSDAGPASNAITLIFRVPSSLQNLSFSGSNWHWKKDGSNVTATYIGALAVGPGDLLDSFEMSARVTKSTGSVVGFGASVLLANDSHLDNNTTYMKISVCQGSASGNGSGGQHGHHPGNNHSNNGNGQSNNGSSHSNNGSGHSVGNGAQGYPGLPPTGSNPFY